MQLEILFRDFDKSEFLENFVRDNVEPVLEHFLSDDESGKLKVILSEDRHRNQARKPSYRCEFILRSGHHLPTLCINKFSPSCHDAIKQCVHALKLQLGRRSKIDQSWFRAAARRGPPIVA